MNNNLRQVSRFEIKIHATHTPHYPEDNYLNEYKHLNEQQQVYASVATEADYRIGLLFHKLKDFGIT